jgi:uncharacterized membrane protein YbhN (UPF0104 family)
VTQPATERRGKRKLLIGVLQYSISFAILAWLFHRASKDASFDRLRDQASLWQLSNWLLLGGAFVMGLAAVTTTFFRWWMMVRTLDLPFRLADAFRLGFVGYLFNFLTLGVVGGDSLKAYFIAQQQPGRKTEAVSSVIADRLLGLYALAIVAAAALLSVEVVDPKVRAVLQGTLGFLLVGGVAGALFIFWGGRFEKPDLNQLTESDTVGQRILTALLLFRSKLRRLFGLLVLSLFTHVLFALCVFMIACGLGGNPPSWGQHLVMVSIANVAGSIPLPGGLGGFEMGLDFLYRRVANIEDSQGFVVALGFRLVTLGIALVGIFYYLVGRREMNRLMHAAEADSQRDEETVEES